jgi:hypothetical protein
MSLSIFYNVIKELAIWTVLHNQEEILISLD